MPPSISFPHPRPAGSGLQSPATAGPAGAPLNLDKCYVESVLYPLRHRELDLVSPAEGERPLPGTGPLITSDMWL